MQPLTAQPINQSIDTVYAYTNFNVTSITSYGEEITHCTPTYQAYWDKLKADHEAYTNEVNRHHGRRRQSELDAAPTRQLPTGPGAKPETWSIAYTPWRSPGQPNGIMLQHRCGSRLVLRDPNATTHCQLFLEAHHAKQELHYHESGHTVTNAIAAISGMAPTWQITRADPKWDFTTDRPLHKCDYDGGHEQDAAALFVTRALPHEYQDETLNITTHQQRCNDGTNITLGKSPGRIFRLYNAGLEARILGKENPAIREKKLSDFADAPQDLKDWMAGGSRRPTTWAYRAEFALPREHLKMLGCETLEGLRKNYAGLCQTELNLTRWIEPNDRDTNRSRYQDNSIWEMFRKMTPPAEPIESKPITLNGPHEIGKSLRNRVAEGRALQAAGIRSSTLDDSVNQDEYLAEMIDAGGHGNDDDRRARIWAKHAAQLREDDAIPQEVRKAAQETSDILHKFQIECARHVALDDEQEAQENALAVNCKARDTKPGQLHHHNPPPALWDDR